MASSNAPVRSLCFFWTFLVICFCFGCGSSSLPSSPIPSDIYIYASPKTGIAPLQVYFKLYTNEDLSSLDSKWYFGDEERKNNLQEFYYTYEKPGVYSVRILLGDFNQEGYSEVTSQTSTTICVFDEKKTERYEHIKTVSTNYSNSRNFALDSEGNIYIPSSNSIQVFSTEGILLRKWTVTSEETYPSLKDVALDDQGNIYAIDSANDTLLILDKDGAITTKWKICNPNEEGPDCERGGRPYKLHVDKSGQIYIAEELSKSWISKFSPEGALKDSYDLSYTSYQLTGMTTDATGNLYILEHGSLILVSDEGSEILKEWEYGHYDDRIYSPKDFNMDSEGNFYISDGSKDVIQKYDSNLNFVTKFGVCEKQEIEELVHLEILNDGTVYVAQYPAYDYENDTFTTSIHIFKKIPKT